MTLSRAKGAQGERELAAELRRIGFPDARRGQQFSGIEGRDVVGLEGVHVEAKRTEKLRLYDALEQAERDAEIGSVPVVFHRMNHRSWVCILRLDNAVSFAIRLLLGLGYQVIAPEKSE